MLQPIPPTPQMFRQRVGIRRVCRIYDRAENSVWRWYTHGDFPKPHYLNARRYWWLDELEAYDRAHTRTWEEQMAAEKQSEKDRLPPMIPAQADGVRSGDPDGDRPEPVFRAIGEGVGR